MINDLVKNQWVWYYDYNGGKQQVLFLEYDTNKCIIKDSNGMLYSVDTSNIFLTENECDLYAFAFNYKRGWLKREMERKTNDELSQRFKDSVSMFPELYI